MVLQVSHRKHGIGGDRTRRAIKETWSTIYVSSLLLSSLLHCLFPLFFISFPWWSMQIQISTIVLWFTSCRARANRSLTFQSTPAMYNRYTSRRPHLHHHRSSLRWTHRLTLQFIISLFIFIICRYSFSPSLVYFVILGGLPTKA